MAIHKIKMDRPIWQETVRGARKQVGISFIHVNVRTSFEYPPIAPRSFDWSAVDDNSYDGECGVVAYGPTEEAAISELMQMLEIE